MTHSKKTGPDDTEYVDGGLYVTETPGSSGAAYSGGRGGAGNIAPPSGEHHPSDRRDSFNEESVIQPPREGEGYSTGRGGSANVHPAGAPPDFNQATRSPRNDTLANLGLAYCVCWGWLMFRDKLKYMIFRKKPPVSSPA